LAAGNNNGDVVHKVLDFTKTGSTVWHRRCGIVAFVHYYKKRSQLPDDIATRIVDACLGVALHVNSTAFKVQ
jgi:hypothetical protein